MWLEQLRSGARDVVASTEAAAKRFTGGNKTEAVALALRRLTGGSRQVGTAAIRRP